MYLSVSSCVKRKESLSFVVLVWRGHLTSLSLSRLLSYNHDKHKLAREEKFCLVVMVAVGRKRVSPIFSLKSRNVKSSPHYWIETEESPNPLARCQTMLVCCLRQTSTSSRMEIKKKIKVKSKLAAFFVAWSGVRQKNSARSWTRTTRRDGQRKEIRIANGYMCKLMDAKIFIQKESIRTWMKVEST